MKSNSDTKTFSWDDINRDISQANLQRFANISQKELDEMYKDDPGYAEFSDEAIIAMMDKARKKNLGCCGITLAFFLHFMKYSA